MLYIYMRNKIFNWKYVKNRTFNIKYIKFYLNGWSIFFYFLKIPHSIYLIKLFEVFILLQTYRLECYWAKTKTQDSTKLPRFLQRIQLYHLSNKAKNQTPQNLFKSSLFKSLSKNTISNEKRLESRRKIKCMHENLKEKITKLAKLFQKQQIKQR